MCGKHRQRKYSDFGMEVGKYISLDLYADPLIPES